MAEAGFVIDEVVQLLDDDPAARVAVLYRANFQSRPFEEMCRRAALRFRLVGGFGFYQRAEVKDLLAYARLAINPDDDVALARVINTPPRGIGKSTIEELRGQAAGRRISLWAALGAAGGSGSGRAAAALGSFRSLIESLRAEAGERTAAELLREISSRTGYLEWLEGQDRAADTDRAGNLKELVAAAEEGQEQGETLVEFLVHAALVSAADDYDESAQLTLMTLHAAKGLEFDHVFLVGMEEGLFPHSRSSKEPEAIEEERRLCYVGMTRARKSLTLTHARMRRSFDRGSGSNQMIARPSRFLVEVPGELVETVAGKPQRLPYRLPLDYSAASQTEGMDELPSRPHMLAGTARSLLGQRVRHPTFGVGTVLDVQEDGEDRRITVSFPTHGTRKLIERYAKLQRV
jgi:DNA helicase-2/ATP-dependent DNA helicase PcrA